MAVIRICCFLILLPFLVLAQPYDSLSVKKNKRLRNLAIITGTGYSASMIGLSQLWYKESERQPFQFFNDNAEWKQMDKVGHFFNSFQLSYGASKGLQWAGIENQRAGWIGATVGFLALLPIEILDGFSADYGASTGDLLANAAGAGFYLGQTALWNEVRIYPKISFHRTGYPPLRENNILGNSLISEFVKDYNGQTFWLSVDMDKFIRFPRWLNLAIGYGANSMVYAHDAANESAGYFAYRQYYVGIDFDLSHIHTQSKILNTVLFVVNMVRLPAPAIEFSKKGTTFKALYF